MAQMSNILIGLLLAVLVGVSFIFVITSATNVYDVSFEDENLDAFDQQSKLINITNQMNESAMNMQGSDKWTDIIGFYIGQGLKTIKLSFASSEAFADMLRGVTNSLKLPMFFISIGLAIFTVILILKVFISGSTGRNQ